MRLSYVICNRLAIIFWSGLLNLPESPLLRMGINGNPERGRGTRGKFLGFKVAPFFGSGASLFGCTYSKVFADVGGYYK